MSFEYLKELYSKKFSYGYWKITNNSDWDWNRNFISCNPNITWEIIENNLDRNWSWYSISNNTMEKGKDKWMKEHIKKEILKKVSYRLLCLKNDDKNINELICNYI